MRADLSVRSPYLRATEFFIPFVSGAAETARALATLPENARPAVVAERFGTAAHVHSARVRLGGMLLATLAGELAIGNGTPAIRAGHTRLAALFPQWAVEAEAELRAEPIPIAKLVGTQLGAILATVVDLTS